MCRFVEERKKTAILESSKSRRAHEEDLVSKSECRRQTTQAFGEVGHGFFGGYAVALVSCGEAHPRIARIICNEVFSRRKSRSVPEAGPDSSAGISLVGKCPNLGRESIVCCRKIREEFSSSVKICRKTLTARNFGQSQPSRVFCFSCLWMTCLTILRQSYCFGFTQICTWHHCCMSLALVCTNVLSKLC